MSYDLVALPEEPFTPSPFIFLSAVDLLLMNLVLVKAGSCRLLQKEISCKLKRL